MAANYDCIVVQQLKRVALASNERDKVAKIERLLGLERQAKLRQLKKNSHNLLEFKIKERS